MIYYDSHVHTAFSTDSDTPMEQMVKQAIRTGLRGLTFTDHMDYHFPAEYSFDNSSDCPPFTFDLEKYLTQICQMEQTYGAGLQIFRGVEIGLKLDAIEKNIELSRDKRLDYSIGSIHLVDDMDPYFPQYWEAFGEKKGIAAYFEAALQNVQHTYAASTCNSINGNNTSDRSRKIEHNNLSSKNSHPDKNDSFVRIDTFGHLDYIVRYAPSGRRFYSYQMYADVIDEILRIIVKRGISLEVNTSGYKNGGVMPNPNEDIIRRFRELGGEQITFGSDAHTAERMAGRFADAERIVRKAGFDHYTTFIGHKPTFHKFDN